MKHNKLFRVEAGLLLYGLICRYIAWSRILRPASGGIKAGA